MEAKASGERTGQVAVIFISRRRDDDPAGYAQAAAVMDSLAARQPGYRGLDGVREPGGEGITVSYWADEAAAVAWRDHPDHAATRERGRGRWYDSYHVIVTQVTRDYRWSAA